MYVKFNGDEPYIYDCEASYKEAYKFVHAKLGLSERPKRDTTDLAFRILYEFRPAAGTLVERYLAARAITLPPPPCLKYHPLLKHPPTGRLFPVMVAERCDVYGAVVGVHCTFLKHDGSWKADVERPKLDFGPAKGNAIRLSPLSDELMVGEGIETVMSVMQMTGRPAWAAGGHLRAMQLPKEVQRPLILADGDRPGEQKARAASARWTVEGRTVAIARPPWGKDFNDVLRGCRHE